jgi:hypothetical protein
VSDVILADMDSAASVVIRHSPEVVWPHLLNQAEWMKDFTIRTVAGERNREGEIKKVTAPEPQEMPPDSHPFFFKTLLLVPFHRFVYKAYTENRSGNYGFTGIEVLSLKDLGKDTAVSFEVYLEFQSWTMTPEELAAFVKQVKGNGKGIWERNFQRLGALITESRVG